MNLKKYLQKQAENEVDNFLTEEDKQFCMQLAEDVKEKPVIIEKRKPGVKLWASVGSAIAVALVAVIVLPVVLTQRPANEIYYRDENIDHKVCQLDELNSGLKNFQILSQEDIVFRCELFFDTISNDKLYYTVKATSTFSEYNLNILVNEKYNYEFEIGGEPLSEQLNDYTINYKMDNITDTVSRAEARYKGVVQLNTEIVYIEYDQLIDLGEQAFFDDIQSVLKIKN